MKAYKGTILTVDKSDSIAKCLVEDSGQIVYVGDELPSQFKNAEVVNLGRKTLCPSFVDTHAHLASFATFNAGLNVMNARSNSEIVERVADFSKRTSAKVLIAFGASPYSVEDGHLVSREQLDLACPDKPVMLVKYDGHACVVNSALLKLINYDVKELRGYHPDSGQMNQEAFFKVSDFITSSLSIPELVKNIQKAMDYYASRGIGMVHTVSGVGFAGDMDITMEQCVAKSAQSGFQLRVFPQSLDVNVALKRKLPRIGGCFACALDGCFGSADAALNEPYEGTSDTGVLYYDDEKVTSFCKAANRAGLQIEMHAIGDAAFDQAARCIKAALDDFPRKDHRHGIIHSCLPSEEGTKICAEYGIHFPMQTSFIDWPQEPDEYLCKLLGNKRANNLNPLRKYWDAGIRISAGSDAPCTDPNPILWMEKACNHSNPHESLTPQEALRMCTFNGAAATFDDDKRGSLEVGKIADMTVLNGNPYDADWKNLKVEQLILQGKPYENQRQGAFSALLKGFVSKAKNY